MKASEFRDLSIEDLGSKAVELRGELFNVRVKKATGQLESTAMLRELRRQIARAETILGEKRGVKK